MIQEKLTGDIDVVAADEFKKKYISMIREKKSDAVFDCSGLDFVDSTGLSAFVAISKTAQEFDKKIILKSLKPTIKKLFEITNLNTLVCIEE